MQILVCGGRGYENRNRVFEVLDRLHADHHITLIIHGACGWDADRPEACCAENLRGADRWANEWAIERQVPVALTPAHWSTLGKLAGRKRNQLMLDSYVVDMVQPFEGGMGTADMIRRAMHANIKVLEIA